MSKKEQTYLVTLTDKFSRRRAITIISDIAKVKGDNGKRTFLKEDGSIVAEYDETDVHGIEYLGELTEQQAYKVGRARVQGQDYPLADAGKENLLDDEDDMEDEDTATYEDEDFDPDYYLDKDLYDEDEDEDELENEFSKWMTYFEDLLGSVNPQTETNERNKKYKQFRKDWEGLKASWAKDPEVKALRNQLNVYWKILRNTDLPKGAREMTLKQIERLESRLAKLKKRYEDGE